VHNVLCSYHIPAAILFLAHPLQGAWVVIPAEGTQLYTGAYGVSAMGRLLRLLSVR
jgi:hypothetical protein